MLQDPVRIGTDLAANKTLVFGNYGLFAISNETSEPGRTVRRGSVGAVGNEIPAKLTISLLETKENKPYGTKRLSVRLESETLDENGRPVVAFVQMLIGQPKAVIPSATLDVLRQAVAGWLLFGDPDGYNTGVTSSGSTLVARMSNGEG